MEGGPNRAEFRGQLHRLRPPEGAAARALCPARVVTEADVIGSRGGRGAQRELCGAAGAQRPPPDKAAWAGVGAAKAGCWEGGAGDPGPRLRTPASRRRGLGAQSAGRR